MSSLPVSILTVRKGGLDGAAFFLSRLFMSCCAPQLTRLGGVAIRESLSNIWNFFCPWAIQAIGLRRPALGSAVLYVGAVRLAAQSLLRDSEPFRGLLAAGRGLRGTGRDASVRRKSRRSTKQVCATLASLLLNWHEQPIAPRHDGGLVLLYERAVIGMAWARVVFGEAVVFRNPR